jgi:uncharacterized protein
MNLRIGIMLIPRGTPSNDVLPATVAWRRVIVFYLLACAISWPFFWWRDMESASFAAIPLPAPLKTASYMWGPGLAALACRRLFPAAPRTLSFFGTSRHRSATFFLVPLIALMLLGGRSLGGIPSRLVPLLLGVTSFFTIFGEELGWRGYLQEELRPLPPLARYVVLGLMWEAWHFTNGKTAPLALILLRVPIVILLSAVIGAATERSRALLVAHTLHLWVDLVFEVPSSEAFAVAMAAVPFWAVLLLWPRAGDASVSHSWASPQPPTSAPEELEAG